MRLPAFICTVIVIGVTLYDVIAIQLWGIDGSVSRWVNDFSPYPIPMFCLGFLAGHFIGPMQPRKPMEPPYEPGNI